MAPSAAGSFPRTLEKKSLPTLGFERELAESELSGRLLGCDAQ